MHLLKQYAKRFNKGNIQLCNTCVTHNLLFLLGK